LIDFCRSGFSREKPATLQMKHDRGSGVSREKPTMLPMKYEVAKWHFPPIFNMGW